MGAAVKGAWAEDAALRHLRARGYRLVARNRRTPYGEVDLWMEDRGVPVFVEVKQRRDARFGEPLEAITPWKLERIKKSAVFLLGRDDRPFRVEAVLVFGGRHRYRIEHRTIELI